MLGKDKKRASEEARSLCCARRCQLSQSLPGCIHHGLSVALILNGFRVFFRRFSVSSQPPLDGLQAALALVGDVSGLPTLRRQLSEHNFALGLPYRRGVFTGVGNASDP